MNTFPKKSKIRQFFVAHKLALSLVCVVSIVVTVQQKSEPISDVKESLPGILALETFSGSVAGMLPSAYAETLAGLQPIPPKYGISKSELDFLLRFRRPVLEIEDKVSIQNAEKIAKDIRERFLEDFSADKDYVSGWATMSDRQAMIAYAVLRTNGSISTYQPRNYVPNDFESLLLSSSGNCSDYAIRLMILLESIDIKAMFISVVTEHFPGHVVVDAYDAEEDTSYILDANFNTIIIMPNSKGKSFVEQIYFAKDKGKFLDDVKIVAFPTYFNSVKSDDASLTLNIINGQRGERVERWERWIRHDRDELLAWWINTPTHRPATLGDLRQVELDGVPRLDKIPQSFTYSSSYALDLRKYLEID